MEKFLIDVVMCLKDLVVGAYHLIVFIYNYVAEFFTNVYHVILPYYNSVNNSLESFTEPIFNPNYSLFDRSLTGQASVLENISQGNLLPYIFPITLFIFTLYIVSTTSRSNG